MKGKSVCRLCSMAVVLCLMAVSVTACGDSPDALRATENLTESSAPVSGSSEAGNGTASGAENGEAENVVAADEMFSDRDLSGEYKESESVKITLNGSTALCSEKGVTVSGSTVTITEEGTYILSGTLNEGMIIVEAEDTDKVQLVLNGVTVTNSANAAVYVRSADKVFVTLADKTANTLENGGSYTAIDDNNIDGVIFSKCDLTVNGTGSLNITAGAGHGIVSKDDLKITGGNITVAAEKHGLSGKDSVRIAGGSITVASDKDGIHADNADDEEKGYIYIADGTLTLETSGDGISASGLLQIDGGSFRITAGGGSGNKTVAKDENGDAVSTKGIKAAGDLVVNDGSFLLDTQDDALHSNSSLTVNGGEYQIATGDDGLHADETTTVAGGSILITASYEGIEGKDVVISGGCIDLYADDDGINAAGGNDGSGFGGMFGGFGGGFGGGSDSAILISGGTIYVNAAGDGLDSNGTLTVTGGTVYVDGPTSSADGALDYESTGQITGGTVLALGAAGMTMNFGDTSTQGAALLNTGNQQAGTEIVLKDADGKVLLSYTSKKSFSSAVVSCPELVQGGTYTLSVGGSDTEFTLDSLIYGDGMGGFGGGMGGGRGDRDNRGGSGNRGDFDGEKPDMSGVPELPDGEMPDMSGVPEPPDGEMPDMNRMPGMNGMPGMNEMPEQPDGSGQMPGDMGGSGGGRGNAGAGQSGGSGDGVRQ